MPMNTELPCEPAGQVPIGGLSSTPTARAGFVRAGGSSAAPARLAPALSSVRRETPEPRSWRFEVPESGITSSLGFVSHGPKDRPLPLSRLFVSPLLDWYLIWLCCPRGAC